MLAPASMFSKIADTGMRVPLSTQAPDEQNMVAAQILAGLADEQAWKEQLTSKRGVIRRMAQEALDEDAAGQTLALDGLH